MLTPASDETYVVRKPWSLGRRITTAAVAFLGIGSLIFLVAGTNTEGRLAGAGSTFVNPLLQHVSTAYQGYLAADRVDPIRQEGSSGDWTAGATALDYDPIGSMGGLVRLSDPTVNFAATEVPLSQEDLQERGLIQFPVILGAAAPVVNLDLGEAQLALDAPTLSAIYRGEITNWSDPAIAALNPGVTLPEQAIAVRFRSDGSGTSWVFTGYLAQSGTWAAGQAAQLDWPLGEGARGSGGIVEAVAAIPGAIGYSEVGQARRAGLTVINLINASGEVVVPGAATVRAATSVTHWKPGQDVASSPVTEGWPMTALVYVVMRADDRQADRALGFFRFFFAEASRQAEALGYVPLPAEVVAEIEAMWAAILNKQS